MSKYEENYTKVTSGYNKILDCIDSVLTREQLEGTSNMAESWLNLAEHYCDEIYHDKTNKSHKKDASNLGDLCSKMFESIKFFYQRKLQGMTPDEYEGVFKPTRIKGFIEINT